MNTTFKVGDRVRATKANWINYSTLKPPYAPNGLVMVGPVYYVEDILEVNGKLGLKILGHPIYIDPDVSDKESMYDSKCFENLSAMKRSK